MKQNKLVSAASVLLTMPLYVKKIPPLGSSAFAQIGKTGIGEAVDVMIAAARQGAKVVNVSCLGTGPNSMLTRRIFAESGIETTTREVVGDIGIKMVMIQDSGFYASILTTGVEIDITPQELVHQHVAPGDLVYLSAGDLIHSSYREAIALWLPTLCPEVKVVMAATPLVEEINPDWLAESMQRVDIFTCSKRESKHLPGYPAEINPAYVKRYLSDQAALVERNSWRGARVITSEGEEQVDTLKIEVTDTRGVAAAHTGVMIASLLAGKNLIEAVQRGNVAGALAATRSGNNTENCPLPEEIEANLPL